MQTVQEPRRLVKVSHWKLDPARTRIDLRAPRRVRSSRIATLQPRRGELVWDEQRFVPSAIEFEAESPAGAVRFRSSGIRWVDSLRFDLAGQLTVGDRIAPVDMRVHDLGWLPDAEHGRRRVFAVRTTIERRVFASARRLRLRDLVDDRSLEVIVHAEWVPDLPPRAA
jgi:hypothetical protein